MTLKSPTTINPNHLLQTFIHYKDDIILKLKKRFFTKMNLLQSLIVLIGATAGLGVADQSGLI